MLSRFLAKRQVCTATLFGVAVYLLLAIVGLKFECLIATWFSVPCPLCGLTRGTMCFLSGDWRQALVYHWFSPFVIIGILVMVGRSFGSRKMQAILLRSCRWADGKKIPHVVVGLLCVYWTARVFGLAGFEF